MSKPGKLELEGAVCINNVTSNRSRERMVRISVDDVVSGVRVIEIAMSLEDFASALFARGDMAATYTVYPRALSLLGMRSENKVVVVPLGESSPYKLSDVDLAAILAPYETDGWVARAEDAENHHNQSKKGGSWHARVAFFRHVDPETGEPVTP